jgi:hypothetical protein
MGQLEEIWNGTAVQRRLEGGSRGLTIVKAVTRQLTVKTLRAGMGSVCYGDL